ncbi:hypothetical protein [Arthrobacter sedimenti]|uniref:Secreted protein n=1 Tax=Arthrobacter sedimenti TaxID=2694931 RepID=A0ABV8WD46_9MICC
MRTGWGILGTGLLLAATLANAGCGTACSTMGYVSVITVKLEGNADAVDEVQMCSDEGCSQRLPDYGPAVPMKTVQPGVPGSDTPTPFIPATPPAAFLGTRTDIDTWAFSISQAGLPEHVTVRALGADKAFLAEQRNDLVWTRVGGSEQCGGPVTTPPIILRVS